jgi:tetratricopeptide (TPR) repeat protein
MKTRIILAITLAFSSISMCFSQAASAKTIQLNHQAPKKLQAQIRGTPRPEVIDAARRYYEQQQREAEAWDRDPQNPLNQDPEIRQMDNSARVNFYDARGTEYRDKGDFARAISYYSKAIQTCVSISYYTLSYCSTPYNNRGVVKELSRDFIGAMADYDKSIRIERDAITYNNRGILKQNLQDFAGALDDLNAAISLGSDAGYYNTRAHIKLKLNDRDGAIQDYRKSAQMYRQAGNSRSYQTVVNNLKAINATP